MREARERARAPRLHPPSCALSPRAPPIVHGGRRPRVPTATRAEEWPQQQVGYARGVRVDSRSEVVERVVLEVARNDSRHAADQNKAHHKLGDPLRQPTEIRVLKCEEYFLRDRYRHEAILPRVHKQLLIAHRSSAATPLGRGAPARSRRARPTGRREPKCALAPREVARERLTHRATFSRALQRPTQPQRPPELRVARAALSSFLDDVLRSKWRHFHHAADSEFF